MSSSWSANDLRRRHAGASYRPTRRSPPSVAPRRGRKNVFPFVGLDRYAKRLITCADRSHPREATKPMWAQPLRE
jgi:hypothetical protein